MSFCSSVNANMGGQVAPPARRHRAVVGSGARCGGGRRADDTRVVEVGAGDVAPDGQDGSLQTREMSGELDDLIVGLRIPRVGHGIDDTIQRRPAPRRGGDAGRRSQSRRRCYDQ